MLEEKNDNLHHADGNTTDSVESTPTASPNEVEATAVASAEVDENHTIIEAIADSNAEESEDESVKERHDIPMQDYDALSMESLVEELNTLVSNELFWNSCRLCSMSLISRFRSTLGYSV